LPAFACLLRAFACRVAPARLCVAACVSVRVCVWLCALRGHRRIVSHNLGDRYYRNDTKPPYSRIVFGEVSFPSAPPHPAGGVARQGTEAVLSWKEEATRSKEDALA